MGLFLLITLSIFFGWCFTEQKNRKLEQLQSQLDNERLLRKQDRDDYEYAVRLLKNTIRELL